MRTAIGDLVLHHGSGLVLFLLGMGIGRFLDRCIGRYLEGIRLDQKEITRQRLWIAFWNGSAYRILFEAKGFTLIMALYCCAVSAMIVLSAVDRRTLEIPFALNGCIFICGLIHFFWNFSQWRCLLGGFFIISLPLLILFILSRGQAVGGGDIKLMAACGFLIGWRRIIPAFFIGCLSGSFYHLVTRKKTGTEKPFAMGPFLSAGVFFSMLL